MERFACLLIAIWSMNAADARAQTNAVPPVRPSTPEVIVEGLAGAAEKTRDVSEIAIDTGKALGGTIDPGAERFIGKVGEYGEAAGHVVGAYGAYREGGAEGMAVYGAQELLEKGGEAAGEAAAGAYATWRAGRVLSGSSAGALGLSFTLGTMAGDAIKENVKINGMTVESHVTNLYFDNLHGRWANQKFEQITSGDSIEQHRQKMRRAGIFGGVQNANEQAAANRAAIAAQSSAAADNAALMNEMMLTIMPAAIAASRQRALQSPRIAPSSDAGTCPEARVDGRCVSFREAGYTPPTPTSGSRISAPLGSTFGTHRDSSSDARRCTGPGCYERSTELGPGCRDGMC